MFTAGPNYSADKASSILATLILGVIANASFIIQPGMVSGFVDSYSLAEAQAGELAAMEMFGIAAASALMAFASLKVNWRLALVISCILAFAGNWLSVQETTMDALVFTRALAGLGHGGIIALSFSAIGLTTRTDRNLGLYLVVLLSYGALGLLLIPYALTAIGMAGIFRSFALLSLAGILLLPFLPSGPKEEEQAGGIAAQIDWKLLVPALIGYLAYNIAQGIMWAYLFLIGLENNLAEQAVANALFVSQIFGVIGALLAVFISAKVVGRFAPITFGIIGGAIFVALLLPGGGYTMFLIAVCGFNLAWNKVLPFILAAIADFDVRGRVMPFALAIQMFGLAVGPYIASQIVGDGDYTIVEIASIIFFILSYVLIIVPIMQHKKSLSPD